MNTQTAYAKALLVDRVKLRDAQQNGDVMLANHLIMEAFEIDVNPLLAQIRMEMGREVNPLLAYRNGKYSETIAKERQDTGIDTLGG
jgi:L-rhamnose isomerase/sugar isomerase